MKRAILLLALTWLVSWHAHAAQLSIAQIAKRFSPSVVTVVALDENDQPLSLGSAFFLNRQGDIVTNYHVLEGSKRAFIKTSKGQKAEITLIVKADPTLDLLIAKTTFKNATPLPLGDSDTVTVGEDIVAIGNPAGLEGTVSRGIVSGVRKAEGIKFIQITAPISPGSSGGPVFSLNGKVIGVATAYLDAGQNLNFAMPINYLGRLKAVQKKLASLSKRRPTQGVAKDTSIVQVRDLHFVGAGSTIEWLDFVIANNGNYVVRNIKLFVVYRNKQGNVVSYTATVAKKPILPKLAQQSSVVHRLKHCWDRGPTCTAEIRILDYEIDPSASTSPADLLFQ